MKIKTIQEIEEFNELVSSGNLTVALFSAEWAVQCKQVLNVMTELAEKNELKSLKFINVPAEDLPEISLKYKIDAVPTVLFFQKGGLFSRINGVNIAELTKKSKELAGIAENDKEELEKRLKSLINSAKVMIFMKGDRDAPRCGFSKQLVSIMNDTGIAYETFDILTDENVRQGLKKYSDWPTYPQVYVNGELIGGLDIIKEILACGELNKTLEG